MKIYDVSMEISEDMIVYKNKPDKKPKLRIAKDYSTSNSYESVITMEMHTGTHIDAPLHMIEEGKTIDSIALENLIKKCKVLDFTEVEDKVTKEILKGKEIEKGDFVLLKTKNSFAKEFDFKFVYLEKSGAEYLKDIGIVGVGIDALGIERDQPSHETHKILLSQGIIIIEGLKLNEVEEGEYTLYALPLKIKGVEAAPARVILID